MKGQPKQSKNCQFPFLQGKSLGMLSFKKNDYTKHFSNYKEGNPQGSKGERKPCFLFHCLTVVLDISKPWLTFLQSRLLSICVFSFCMLNFLMQVILHLDPSNVYCDGTKGSIPLTIESSAIDKTISTSRSKIFHQNKAPPLVKQNLCIQHSILLYNKHIVYSI